MPSVPSPSYLLIEEYGPLALALRSALKKFAPGHGALTAKNLREARETILAQPPELIILDFDPPFPGTMAFLEEVRAACPETRVLVLAPGISREVMEERGARAGLHFLEKPFELMDFGTAVQAMLAPGSSRGTLADLSIADVAMLGCVGGLTACFEIRAHPGGEGALHLAAGRIQHAATRQNSGSAALIEMLGWKKSSFLEEGLPAHGPRSFAPSWRHELTEALRARKSEDFQLEAELEKTGKRILLIDDTEMLLIFVADSLALAEPTWEIFSASSGARGVEEAKRLVPDLVLVDFSMPDMLGDEVCRQLLIAPETSRLPVIMMSGHESEMKRVTKLLPNVVASIAKPFLSEALVALVKGTLPRGPLAEMPPQIFVPQIKSENVSEEIAPVLPGFSTVAEIPVKDANEVLLDLPLDVVAMEFTSHFQIGSIRARLAAPTVAIQIPALAARASLPLGTGFQLGDVDLDARGQLSLIRLRPTTQPFRPVRTNGAFEVNGVTVVPANARERSQLMSSANSSMTMQLFAPLELVSLDLSPFLEVWQLVLRCRSNDVRVTLNSANDEVKSGATFRTSSIALDDSRHIAELTLTPAET